MRVKWADTHSDEVFFRDTAHGFLAWAVATLFTFGLIAAIGLGAARTGVEAGATVAASVSDDAAYYADSLYRGAPAADAAVSAETTRILVKSARDGAVSPADRTYLASQVAARTGVSQTEAEGRVNTTLNQIDTARAKTMDAAEKVRKAMVAFHTALCISLLVGAFIASVSAALGGKLRDND